jgi:hypothetical protein
MPISGTDSRSLCSAAAIAIDPFRLGARGQHRQECGGAELGRLLDQPIEPDPPDRREQQPQIRLGFGGAQLVLGQQDGAAAALLGQMAQPLAGAFVECRHRRAGSEPQHVAQTMRLPRIERNRGAGGQSPGDIEARRTALGQGVLLGCAADLSQASRRAKITA